MGKDIQLYDVINLALDNKLITHKQHIKLLDEYGKLTDSEITLNALECAGVDNWCGYGDAIDLMKEWNNEE